MVGTTAQRPSKRMQPQLALTVMQPWAWTMIHAGNDIASRSQPTNHRGRIYIHAGSEYWEYDRERIARALRLIGSGSVLPAQEELAHGVLIGTVELFGCVQGADRRRSPVHSPWAMERRWHWRLRNPEPLAQPIPVRGARPGLWTPAVLSAAETNSKRPAALT